MAFLEQSTFNRLYVASSSSSDQGWLCYFVSPSAKNLPKSINLADALNGVTKSGGKTVQLNGNFAFAPVAPTLTTSKEAQDFYNKLTSLASSYFKTSLRGFLWLRSVTSISKNTSFALGFLISPVGDEAELEDVEAGAVPVFSTTADLGLDAEVWSNLDFEVSKGVKLSLQQSSTSLDLMSPSGSTVIGYSGKLAPIAQTITSAQLQFSGPQRGCFTFDINIQYQDIYNKWGWGFEVSFPSSSQSGQNVVGWYPFADALSSSIKQLFCGFNASLDLTDNRNRYSPLRTYFAFTGKNYEAAKTNPVGSTTLNSYYRTAYGQNIQLLPVTLSEATNEIEPSMLVFAKGLPFNTSGQNFYVAPHGDYIMQTDEPPFEGWDLLLCGLSGTESISFQSKDSNFAGDRLRFVSRQPAYILNYPFPPTSPVGPPHDPSAPLLYGTYKTSWATIVRGDGAPVDSYNHYNSQPKGASLYGKDTFINPTYSSMFGFMDPGYQLPCDDSFSIPLLPYGSVTPKSSGGTKFTGAQYENIEREVMALTRRQEISNASPQPSGSSQISQNGSADPPADLLVNTTTPSGLIAQVDMSTGAWHSVMLAQNDDKQMSMQFIQPDKSLQEVFQTSDLFFVGANNYQDILGKFESREPSGATGSYFYNSMNIEDWIMTANVGQNNRYADYRNVMIIKGRKGKLVDLVKNSESWTKKLTFGSPSDLNNDTPPVPQPPNDAELVILAEWLQSYITDALNQTSPMFENFQNIASDENWTGILFLKMDITPPDQLKGLIGGINPVDFYAHHFGVQISPIKGTTIEIDQKSAMFGLVYYVDPQFTPPANAKDPVKPVPPTPGKTYDFKVLTLQVLFENSAIKDFKSWAQLTINDFFDQPVANIINTSGQPVNELYNSIVLKGTYQHQNGRTLYLLNKVGEDLFGFRSNVMNQVEISKTQFSTLGTTKVNGVDQVASRFDLYGYIDFKVLQKEVSGSNGGTSQTLNFDIFSFGNEPGEHLVRKGLRFASLAIDMTFPKDDPSSRVMSFDTTKMTFDTQQSSPPRDGSLYLDYALQIEGLVVGDEKKPSDSGFLPVSTAISYTDTTTGDNEIESIRLAGVTDPWYGLQFQLKMGSPGELAGKVDFTSHVICAWSPSETSDDSDSTESYAVQLGLKLPGTGGGAKLLSLQGVVKLSIGDLRMIYAEPDNSTSPAKPGGFLLNLSEIALKFLGLLKIPPSGATNFFLFGNPEAKGKASELGWYAVYSNEQSGGGSDSENELATTTEIEGESR